MTVRDACECDGRDVCCIVNTFCLPCAAILCFHTCSNLTIFSLPLPLFLVADLELEQVVDESGWKQVHGDVFRPPSNLILFAALLGTGFQLLALAGIVISLALIGTLYVSRGTTVSAFLAAYALTSFVAGYTGARYYKSSGGGLWKKVMVLTACVFPGVCAVVTAMLNAVAYSYASAAVVTLYSCAVVFAIWAFVSCPLVMLGE
jgi:transmembrane 9 superfamily protein 3